MNEDNLAVESNGYVNAVNPASSPGQIRQIALLNPSNIAVRQNLSREVQRSINDSINYNIALLVFSSIKAIGSIAVLGFTDFQCDRPLREWTTYSIFHDLLYIITLVLKVKTISRNNFMRSVQNRGPNNSQRDDNSNRDVFGYHLSNDDSVFLISDEAERKNRSVSALSAACRTLYYVLFIYAQVLYFHVDSNCPEGPKIISNLMAIQICLGYIFIGMPVLFVVLACLCLPFLLIFSYVFSRGAQTPVSKTTLKKLKIIKFSTDLPGNHECSICMNDYSEGDKLIQLKCSPMHHYHEDCLKKWFKVNGQCPICRASIEEEGSAPKTGDLELANTIQSLN